MFISINKLANELPKDKPDNLAASALQEGLGTSPFGDGDVEALDGFPDGFEIQAPEAPEEYSPGLDKALKQIVEAKTR